jgi:membrane protein YdbS with pleckstrin-like domain
MRKRTKLVAIILLLIAAIFSAYYQVTHGFSYLQSAGIVLMLVVIVLLVAEKQA